MVRDAGGVSEKKLGLFSRLSFPNKEEGFSYVVPLRPHSGEHSGNVDFDLVRVMSGESFETLLHRREQQEAKRGSCHGNCDVVLS
jgi:hypothetical protein